SSWSCPSPDCPFAVSTPTTWKGSVPMRTVWPMGSALPKRFCCTVAPRTTTLVARVTSSGVKLPPRANVQLRMSKYCGSVPVTRVYQFWLSETTCALVPAPGAASAMVGTSCSMALISSFTRVLVAPPPRRIPPLLTLPELMYSRLVPMDAIWFCTCCSAPCPRPTVAITAPTPMMMPSMVSSERILLRVSARIAIRKIASKSIMTPVIELPDCQNRRIERLTIDCPATVILLPSTSILIYRGQRLQNIGCARPLLHQVVMPDLAIPEHNNPFRELCDVRLV